MSSDKLNTGGLDYSIIFNAISNLMAFTEYESGRIVDVNTAWIRATGIIRDKSVGKTAFELGLWSNHTEREACIAEINKNGRIANFEANLIMKSVKIPHLISGELVKMNNKQYVLWEFRDISERKQAEENILKSLREKESLIRELYHRTKNTMQVIRSMLVLQAVEYPDNKELHKVIKNTEDRIQAISLVHQMLYKSQDLSQISIKDYIFELSKLTMYSFSISTDRISLNIKVDDQYFLLDTAIPLGLILNELMTNSLKYAFPDNRKGEITITMTKEKSDKSILHYHDNGVGVPAGFEFRNQTTLGLKLIHSIGEEQMVGKVVMENKNGVSCLIEFQSDLYKARV